MAYYNAMKEKAKREAKSGKLNKKGLFQQFIERFGFQNVPAGKLLILQDMKGKITVKRAGTAWVAPWHTDNQIEINEMSNVHPLKQETYGCGEGFEISVTSNIVFNISNPEQYFKRKDTLDENLDSEIQSVFRKLFKLKTFSQIQDYHFAVNEVDALKAHQVQLSESQKIINDLAKNMKELALQSQSGIALTSNLGFDATDKGLASAEIDNTYFNTIKEIAEKDGTKGLKKFYDDLLRNPMASRTQLEFARKAVERAQMFVIEHASEEKLLDEKNSFSKEILEIQKRINEIKNAKPDYEIYKDTLKNLENDFGITVTAIKLVDVQPNQKITAAREEANQKVVTAEAELKVAQIEKEKAQVEAQKEAMEMQPYIDAFNNNPGAEGIIKARMAQKGKSRVILFDSPMMSGSSVAYSSQRKGHSGKPTQIHRKPKQVYKVVVKQKPENMQNTEEQIINPNESGRSK